MQKMNVDFISTVSRHLEYDRSSTYFCRYSPYGQDRLGMSYEVLVTETSHDGRFYVGHNEFYEQVLVPKDPNLMGKLVRVEILETCKFSMTGRLIEGPAKSPGLASPMDHGQVSGVASKVAKPVEARKIILQSLVLLVTSSYFRLWTRNLLPAAGYIGRA